MCLLRCLQDNITGLPGMSRAYAAHAWIHAASQMEHGTRRKLGFLRGVFPPRRRAGNTLNSRNPRKPMFATGTGTTKSQCGPGRSCAS